LWVIQIQPTEINADPDPKHWFSAKFLSGTQLFLKICVPSVVREDLCGVGKKIKGGFSFCCSKQDILTPSVLPQNIVFWRGFYCR
jgi:hypothetical protein